MTPEVHRAWVSVLTADARGAIAVIRVWGRDAVRVACAAFRSDRGRLLSEAAPNALRFGRLGAGPGDEVVAVITGESPPQVEIHCHGGPAAVALVRETLMSLGAERAPVADWLRSQAPGTCSAEALEDLPHAGTVRMAALLLDQAGGALDDEFATITKLSGEDAAGALTRVETLLRRSAVGLRRIAGWTVALAGRPNVGKSSLLNALAGFDRAIVAPTPGTTRDVVTHRTAFLGWPVELADTAGLRDTADPLEAAGIALARARQGTADLTVLVLDGSVPLTDAERAQLASRSAWLVVANKADLPAAWDASPGITRVSAARGDGIEELIGEVAARLVPDPPPEGSAVPFLVRHVEALERARAALREGVGRGAATTGQATP